MDTYKKPVEFICEKFLDLVEKKPFYTIQVKELVQYAGIGRSTFYLYFDSIYAVVQRLEDDFMDGFLNGEKAISIIINRNKDEVEKQNLFLKKNNRVLKLLTGPNGDSSFHAKLKNRFRSLCDTVWDYKKIEVSQEWRDYVGSYIAGGCVSLFLHAANTESSIDETLNITYSLINDLSRTLLRFDDND